MHTVYIIKNKANKLYIGQTNDIHLRLKRHNEDKVFSTKNRGPWTPIYTKIFSLRSEAMRWEKFLKKQKGGIKLYTIINEQSAPG